MVDTKVVNIYYPSFIDYPKRVSAVVFIKGCNYRCFYCHNKDVAYVNPDKYEVFTWRDIKRFLRRINKNIIDSIVITGGEPTEWKGLYKLVKKIKRRGFKVKLDTNGTHPEIVKKLLDKKLLDYISMDLKAPLKSYSYYKKVVGNVDDKLIYNTVETMKLILKSGIDYEFRTTMNYYVGIKEVIEIVENTYGTMRLMDIKGKIKRYAIQTADKDKIKLEPNHIAYLEQFIEKVVDRT